MLALAFFNCCNCSGLVCFRFSIEGLMFASHPGLPIASLLYYNLTSYNFIADINLINRRSRVAGFSVSRYIIQTVPFDAISIKRIKIISCMAFALYYTTLFPYIKHPFLKSIKFFNCSWNNCFLTNKMTPKAEA